MHGPILPFIFATSLCAAPYHANLDSALFALESSPEPAALFLGDSLTFRDGSFYVPLRDRLQAWLGNGGAGWQSMSRWTGGGFDPGWAEGQVNTDINPHMSLDGLWAFTNSTAWARLDPAPGTKRMRFVVNGSGSFGLWNTATLQTTFHTAPGVFDVTFPGSAGRVWVQPSANGNVTVLGAMTTNDQPGLIVSRGANGGWRVANFLQRDETFEQVFGIVRSGPDVVTTPHPAEQIGLVKDDDGSEPSHAQVTMAGEYPSGTLRQLRPRSERGVPDFSALFSALCKPKTRKSQGSARLVIRSGARKTPLRRGARGAERIMSRLL